MKMTGRAVVLAVVWTAVAALQAVSVRADNWPNWRGPGLDGVAAGTGYVASWSPTEHVLWRGRLPGLGASTPAVWGENVVVKIGRAHV